MDLGSPHGTTWEICSDNLDASFDDSPGCLRRAPVVRSFYRPSIVQEGWRLPRSFFLLRLVRRTQGFFVELWRMASVNFSALPARLAYQESSFGAPPRGYADAETCRWVGWPGSRPTSCLCLSVYPPCEHEGLHSCCGELRS